MGGANDAAPGGALRREREGEEFARHLEMGRQQRVPVVRVHRSRDVGAAHRGERLQHLHRRQQMVQIHHQSLRLILHHSMMQQ